MSVNLLELLKEHFSGDVVSNLAAMLGESPKNTETALQNALPSLLAGLVNKGSDSNSLTSLLKLVTEDSHDGGLLSNLGALSRGGEETNRLIEGGGKLLSTFFGDKSSGIIDLIASVSGIGNKSSSSLLGFLSPVVLGLVGKTLKLENLGSIAGLTSLLKGQEGILKNLIPAGLGNLLGGNIFGSVGSSTPESDFDKVISTLDVEDTVVHTENDFSISETLDKVTGKIEEVAEDSLATAKNVVGDIGETASKYGAQVMDEGKEFAASAADAFEEGGSKWLPWLLILAALALLWGLLKSCSSTEPTAEGEPPKEVVQAPAPQPAVTPTAPAATSEPAKTEAPTTVVESIFYEKNLSTGYVLKAAKDGLESKLIGFIESNNPINNDLWFTMDGITFDTAKATIKKESEPQINHISEILKAFPKVKIKIGGYTDNTGKAASNLKLSQNRASAVLKALVSKGTKANRLEAEGYGSEHPVASNDTPEGKQQNRRIDVKVTEK